MPDQDVLVADLEALGRGVRLREPDPGLAEAVLARVATRAAPARRDLAGRVAEAVSRYRRRAGVAAAVLLVGLASAPPVRATVAEWLDFAGVLVRDDPGPAPRTAGPPPTVPPGPELREAARQVGFAVLYPRSLGRPDGVEVSADRRMLSMSWDGPAGPIRLDQFDGQLDHAVLKMADDVRFVDVDGDFAVWFPAPHEMAVLDADGTRRTETARLAGHTLIWQQGTTSLRLEGEVSLRRALRIAASTVPVG